MSTTQLVNALWSLALGGLITLWGWQLLHPNPQRCYSNAWLRIRPLFGVVIMGVGILTVVGALIRFA